jgi:hypothetical protein
VRETGEALPLWRGFFCFEKAKPSERRGARSKAGGYAALFLQMTTSVNEPAIPLVRLNLDIEGCPFCHEISLVIPLVERDEGSGVVDWVSVICGRLLQQVSSTVWTACRLRETTFTLAMNTLSSWAGAWRAFSPLGPTRHYPENHYPKSNN